jgi:5'-nucleotidase
MGGVARRAIMKPLEKRTKCITTCRRYFSGTPYFNYYGGELEFKLMSMMQYDASTIGNHDFDNGVEGLYTTTAC